MKCIDNGRAPWLLGITLALAALPMYLQGRTAQAGPLRSNAKGYELEVLVNGVPARTYYHRGETQVLGRPGDRYTLRVWNRGSSEVEAVVSVDGRDVIDGQPGDFLRKHGYIVRPGSFVDIDGWRLSDQEVAAFRFTSVANSYAARTGSARNVGVIGAAIFTPRVYEESAPLVKAAPPRRRGAADEGVGAAPPVPPSAGPAGGHPAAAPASSAGSGELAKSRQRPGLGTEFGEAVGSSVHYVSFVRATPSRPAVVLGLRYNDRKGLMALGIDVDGARLTEDQVLRGSADPFPVSRRRYASPPPGWRP